MDCEVCGKREAVAIAIVDGARLNVCETCLKFGRLEKKLFDENPERGFDSGQTELVLIDGYGRVLSAARLGKKMTVQDLCKKLNISERDIEKFESESLKPIEKIARKLERELNVKILVEE
jgi:putative transcription factor